MPSPLIVQRVQIDAYDEILQIPSLVQDVLRRKVCIRICAGITKMAWIASREHKITFLEWEIFI